MGGVMSHAPYKRLPFQPLEDYILLRWPDDHPSTPDGRASNTRIATMCHTHRTVISMARVNGVTHRSADKYACAIGAHPLEIWPEFHDDILAEDDDVFEWAG
jgi:hypothetical protein